MANKKVRVYSTPTCPYCRMTKEYLKQNNVTFEDIDVSANENAANQMVELSGQMGVPVLDVEGQVIVGFDRPKIAAALGLK